MILNKSKVKTEKAKKVLSKKTKIRKKVNRATTKVVTTEAMKKATKATTKAIGKMAIQVIQQVMIQAIATKAARMRETPLKKEMNQPMKIAEKTKEARVEMILVTMSLMTMNCLLRTTLTQHRKMFKSRNLQGMKWRKKCLNFSKYLAEPQVVRWSEQ